MRDRARRHSNVAGREAAPGRPSGTARPGDHVRPDHRAVLALQRSAGNKAVTALLAGRAGAPRAAGPPVVQRYREVDPNVEPALAVDAIANSLDVDHVSASFFYAARDHYRAGLRLADDGRMAVPNISETKDLYADEGIRQASNQVLGAQTSVMSLEPVGNDVLTVPKPHAPGQTLTLNKVRPTASQSTGPASFLGDMALIEHECIEAAHKIATGGGRSSTGSAVLGGDLRADVTHTSVELGTGWTAEAAAAPAKEKERLGVNEFAVPEVGEMLATYTTKAANAGEWNYHFAGVVARSGGDYVTLENYARGADIDKAIGAIWPTLSQAKAMLAKYHEMLEYIDPDNPGRFDKAKRAAITNLQQAARDAREITNALDGVTVAALWYFQMYGPARKMVDDGAGPKAVDQSFHAAMVKTGDFLSPLTLRISASAAPSDVDPGILLIEPPAAGEAASALWRVGGGGSLGSARRLVAQVGRRAYTDIVQQAAGQEAQLSGPATAVARSRYGLKIARLGAAMQDKAHSTMQQLPAMAGLPVGDRQRLLRQLMSQMNFYFARYGTVAAHAEFEQLYRESPVPVANDALHRAYQALVGAAATFEEYAA